MQTPRVPEKMPSSNSFDVVAILIKHSNAEVASISDQDVVVRINKQTEGTTELPSTHNTNKKLP